MRGRDENKKLTKLPAEELDGVRFFRSPPAFHKKFWGYSYNPGMWRLSDYERIAPIAEVGDKEEVSIVFKLRDYQTIHLEIPAVCHIGWGKHIEDITKPKADSYFRNRVAKYKSKFKIFKWRVFGLPQKWW